MVLHCTVISIVITLVQSTPYWHSLYRFPAAYTSSLVPTDSTSGSDRSQCTCGQLPGLSNRIVSGWATSGTEHPFLAMILKRGRLNCGGSIINNLYVLTAAHCIKRKEPLSTISVLLGVHDRREIELNLEEFQYNAVKRIVHPYYGKSQMGGTDNDLGLIKLDRPIIFNTFVQPICLPTFDTSGVRSAWVQGWGLDSVNGSTTQVPMEAKLNILTSSECLMSPSRVILGTPDLHICAIHQVADSCQGDSGGPLFYHLGSYTIQIGLVSEGIGCATPGYPGIYTRVEKYVSWIYMNTADAVTCTM